MTNIEIINNKEVEYKIIPSVQVVLMRQGKDDIEFFLLHRIAGGFQNQWSFPGGAIDSGETDQQTSCRETFEETGIKIKKKDLHYLRTTDSTTDRVINNKQVSCKYVIQVFIVFADKLSPSNNSPKEHDQGKWFPSKEALKMHDNIVTEATRNGEDITADKIPNALAPKTLETIKILSSLSF
ncbi:MAG: NUDIX domain-containing protein [Candidatus Shapirobacteria bacterium]|nr:NUDIX domain-containing protein [Candidatus Shapirobacteria bacterium]